MSHNPWAFPLFSSASRHKKWQKCQMMFYLLYKTDSHGSRHPVTMGVYEAHFPAPKMTHTAQGRYKACCSRWILIGMSMNFLHLGNGVSCFWRTVGSPWQKGKKRTVKTDPFDTRKVLSSFRRVMPEQVFCCFLCSHHFVGDIFISYMRNQTQHSDADTGQFCLLVSCHWKTLKKNFFWEKGNEDVSWEK